MKSRSPTEIEIFNAALELDDPAQRERYLSDICAGNAPLRTRLDALLDAHGRGVAMFQPLVPTVSRPNAELAADDRIGSYRVIEKLGEGGCGVVYAAEQQQPLRRCVALKIIKAGMDTRAVITRFEAERQALALMDHSNIAKIFDAGSTEAGRPYFVMELVKGLRITDYCVQNNLSVRERLNLFLQVCDAVQHAHQKGIIHRDLKPSNILVRGEAALDCGSPLPLSEGHGMPAPNESARGRAHSKSSAQPKIIDFGIAKAIQGKLTDETIHTALHQFIGTPAYMSPEQADLSPDIDTRTDIYSLGVLLYELLTGRPPFDNHELLTAGLDEMRRIIREVEPARPSAHLAPKGGGARLLPSLIFQHEKGSREARQEPPTRSLSATRLSGFSTDLDWIVLKCLEKDRSRRYETANALSADLRRYLSHEPILAHPPSAAYRVAKFVRRNKLAMSAAFAVSLILVIAVLISSWQAVLARQQAVLAKQSERKARAVTDFLVDELLKTNPFSEAEADPSKEAFATRAARALDGRFTDPLIEADLRIALLGGLKASNAVAQCEKAWAIRKRVLGDAHSQTLIAAAALVDSYLGIGKRNEAEKLLASAVTAVRKSSDPTSEGAGQVLCAKGMFLRWDKRPADALPWFEEGLSIVRRTARPNDWRYIVLMGDFAFATMEAGKHAQAEKQWNELIEHCERELGPDNPMTAQALKGKAALLVANRRASDAKPLLLKVIPIFERVAGTNNKALLDAEDMLADCYDQAGDAETAAKIYSSTYPRWATHFSGRSALAHSEDIANFFVRHLNHTEARKVFEGLRECFEKHPPEAAWQFELLLAATAATMGWPAAGEVCRKYIDDFNDTLWILLNKAWVFRAVADNQSYERVLTKALARIPAVASAADAHVPLEIAALGNNEPSLSQLDQLESSIRHLESVSPDRNTNQQLWAYRAIGQFELRRRLYDKSLATLEKAASKQSAPDAYLLFLKAACLYYLGQRPQAQTLFEEAVILSNSQLPGPAASFENFLTPGQLYQHLVIRRETEALLKTR